MYLHIPSQQQSTDSNKIYANVTTLVMSIYSYLFISYVIVKKSNYVLFYSSMLYFDSLKFIFCSIVVDLGWTFNALIRQEKLPSQSPNHFRTLKLFKIVSNFSHRNLNYVSIKCTFISQVNNNRRIRTKYMQMSQPWL